MTSDLTEACRLRLATCHRDLVRVFCAVAERVPVLIVEGHRGEKEQHEDYVHGTSELDWPHGPHNGMPSRAVDVCPLPLDWKNVKAFRELAVIVREEAARIGVVLEWGGDWQHFKDYPHWQLPKGTT